MKTTLQKLFFGSQKHPFFQTNLLCHFDDKPLILLGFNGFRGDYLEFAKTTRLSELTFLAVFANASLFIGGDY